MSDLSSEKQHFNDLASDRDEQGFIPDLRRMGDNNFFYLSPYRRQYLANLSLRHISDFTLEHLTHHLKPGDKVLDLGCGNGWFALELARAGYQVTAMDLSEDNIRVAKETLSQADLSPGHGAIFYSSGDLNFWEPEERDFKAVCYNGSLHHIPQSNSILKRVANWMTDTYYVMAAEPLPDNYTEGDAIIPLLVRMLLSVNNSWYENLPLPQNESELNELMQEILKEFSNWADKSEDNQSPLNNSSNGAEILDNLNRMYQTIEVRDFLPFFHRMIGGFRLENDEENYKLANSYLLFEKMLLKHKVVNPGGFLYFGQSR